MTEFQLFRIKVHPPFQRTLFGEPPDVLAKTISSYPSVELRTNITWHIGNISWIDKTGLYFRVGKTTKLRSSLYQDGNFEDAELEAAPYTHVIVDLSNEVAAIAKNANLSHKVIGIATQLAKLLTYCEEARKYDISFEINDLKNPDSLIKILHRAREIYSFSVTFTRRNPIDLDDYRPAMERLLEKIKAERGTTEVKGKLDSHVCESLARSAAASGDDAKAWLEADGEWKRVYLKGNPVIVREENVESLFRQRTLVERIRVICNKIMGKE